MTNETSILNAYFQQLQSIFSLPPLDLLQRWSETAYQSWKDSLTATSPLWEEPQIFAPRLPKPSIPSSNPQETIVVLMRNSLPRASVTISLVEDRLTTLRVDFPTPTLRDADMALKAVQVVAEAFPNDHEEVSSGVMLCGVTFDSAHDGYTYRINNLPLTQIDQTITSENGKTEWCLDSELGIPYSIVVGETGRDVTCTWIGTRQTWDEEDLPPNLHWTKVTLRRKEDAWRWVEAFEQVLASDHTPNQNEDDWEASRQREQAHALMQELRRSPEQEGGAIDSADQPEEVPHEGKNPRMFVTHLNMNITERMYIHGPNTDQREERACIAAAPYSVHSPRCRF